MIAGTWIQRYFLRRTRNDFISSAAAFSLSFWPLHPRTLMSARLIMSNYGIGSGRWTYLRRTTCSFQSLKGDSYVIIHSVLVANCEKFGFPYWVQWRRFSTFLWKYWSSVVLCVGRCRFTYCCECSRMTGRVGASSWFVISVTLIRVHMVRLHFCQSCISMHDFDAITSLWIANLP